MENLERIIVTLTTYSKRIENIPKVLDTIFGQTLLPDLVVLNISYDESIPPQIKKYIDIHGIEVNRVPDTKVYKKLIPTLKKYPHDCVISIDDDWLYPNGMIEDFMAIHKQYPNYPISGNREVLFGFQCHCGCASLTKAEYFGKFLVFIDDDVIANSPSDDIVYTYLCNKAGHPYIRSMNQYFKNLKPYNEIDGYSDSFVGYDPIKKSYNYMESRFGKLTPCIDKYLINNHVSSQLNDMYENMTRSYELSQRIIKELRGSYSYRLGNFLLTPFSLLKRILVKL